MNLTPNKRRQLPAWAAALFVIFPLCGALLAGCGGGSSPPVSYPVIDLAPGSLSGHTLTFTDPDQPQFTTTYVFSASTYTSPSGDSGTYTYVQSVTTNNQGTVNIVSAFSPALTYTLKYTASTGGTYVNQVSATGTFTMQ
jgi:hypothetical protein